VPPMRLVVFGHGEDFTGFARLAHMWGRWCRASPMANDVDLLRDQELLRSI
jgi:hypothetical protein